MKSIQTHIQVLTNRHVENDSSQGTVHEKMTSAFTKSSCFTIHTGTTKQRFQIYPFTVGGNAG